MMKSGNYLVRFKSSYVIICSVCAQNQEAAKLHDTKIDHKKAHGCKTRGFDCRIKNVTDPAASSQRRVASPAHEYATVLRHHARVQKHKAPEKMLHLTLAALRSTNGSA